MFRSYMCVLTYTHVPQIKLNLQTGRCFWNLVDHKSLEKETRGKVYNHSPVMEASREECPKLAEIKQVTDGNCITCNKDVHKVTWRWC